MNRIMVGMRMANYEIYLNSGYKRLRLNRENFEKFDKMNVLEGLKVRRRLKYLRMFSVLNRLLKKDLRSIEKDDVEKYLIYLHEHGFMDSTKDDYFRMLKRVVKFFNKKIKMQNYKMKLNKKYKLPEDILRKEEVEKQVEFCETLKKKAAVSMLFNSGTRNGEFRKIKKGIDVTIDSEGIIFKVNGKTGERIFRVVEIVNTRHFLEYYETVKDGDYLFDYTEFSLNSMLKETAKKAGIIKKVYPHLYRHSSATFTAPLLTEASMCIYYGWTIGSKMPRIYIHLSGKNISPNIIEINKILAAKTIMPLPKQLQLDYQNDPQYEEFRKWKERQPTLMTFAKIKA